MADNSTIYINQLNIEPRADGITAITLTVVYGDTKAEATIRLRPGYSISQTDTGIRDQIRQLGDALQKAALSPHGINRGDFVRPGPLKEADGR
jgi:hypothetical protein